MNQTKKRPFLAHETDRQFYDAFALLWGWNGEQDKALGAKKLLELLAKQKAPKNSTLKYHLGLAYFQGLLPSDNPEDAALQWFFAASEGSSFDGLKAMKLLKKTYEKNAAEGRKEAQYYLARYYHLKKKAKKRDRWLLLSAEQGYPPAQAFWDDLNHPKGLSKAAKYELRRTSEKYVVAPLSRQLSAGFEALNARHEETLAAVTKLGDGFDLLAEEQAALRKEVLAYFKEVEEQVTAFAASTPLEVRKKQEETLRRIFGEHWDNGSLHPDSKKSLLSAGILMNYAMEQHLDDCRGIVIAVTSALERELRERFYTGFQTFLQERGDPIHAELKKTFTMGSFFYIISENYYPPQKGKKGKKIQSPGLPKSDDERRQINAYLASILSDGIFDPATDLYYSDVFTKRGGDRCFTRRITDVVKQFRNPAAHTEATPMSQAIACCDYVVGNAQLQKVVGLLLELVSMTDKFKHRTL